MNPYYEDGPVTVYHGDCIEVMATLPADSVHAVCCDPPYGLEFLGRDWDSFRGDGWRTGAGITATGYTDGANRIPRPAYGGGDSANATCEACGGRMRGANRCECPTPEWRVKGQPIAGRGSGVAQMRAFQDWCEQWAREAFRVLKPGGHLLAFGGTRTFHRLASGIEDAGFEIRDSIAWLYAQGFPKSLNVAKAIDRQLGAEREETGRILSTTGRRVAPSSFGAAGSEEAAAWEGWGTALKPAWEPIIVARKPLAEDTVAENVLAHGTGALNIRAARIGSGPSPSVGIRANQEASRSMGWRNVNPAKDFDTVAASWKEPRPDEELGRWPANVVLDPVQAAELDRQSGISTSPDRPVRQGGNRGYGDKLDGRDTRAERAITFGNGYGDTGGISRVFHVAEPDPEPTDAGRWPPNVVLDREQAAELDRQSGTTTSGYMPAGTPRSNRDGWAGPMPEQTAAATYGDQGGASRFFPIADPDPGAGRFRYVPKATAAERPSIRQDGAGLGKPGYAGGIRVRTCDTCGSRFPSPPAVQSCGHDGWSWQEPLDKAPDTVSHPTVKPVALLRWLVRLVTPKGGTILEPFAGSGSTVEAAVLEGFACIAIEREAEYLPLILQRIRKPHAVGLDLDLEAAPLPEPEPAPAAAAAEPAPVAVLPTPARRIDTVYLDFGDWEADA